MSRYHVDVIDGVSARHDTRLATGDRALACRTARDLLERERPWYQHVSVFDMEDDGASVDPYGDDDSESETS